MRGLAAFGVGIMAGGLLCTINEDGMSWTPFVLLIAVCTAGACLLKRR